MLYTSDNAPLMTCHVAKFQEVTSPNPKVISANTLNYKPIYNPPWQKIVGEPLSPVGYTLARLGHSIARVKISGAQHPLRAKIWHPEIFDFRGIIALLNFRN